MLTLRLPVLIFNYFEFLFSSFAFKSFFFFTHSNLLTVLEVCSCPIPYLFLPTQILPLCCQQTAQYPWLLNVFFVFVMTNIWVSFEIVSATAFSTRGCFFKIAHTLEPESKINVTLLLLLQTIIYSVSYEHPSSFEASSFYINIYVYTYVF